MKFKHSLLILFSFFIVSCITVLQIKQLPKNIAENTLFKIDQLSPKQQSSLLTIQYTEEQWRWVQYDPLGVPLARLLLSEQGWKNDGFLPPNTQAQQLFSAIATHLYPNESLFLFSSIENGIYKIKGKTVWIITPQANGAVISLPDSSKWRIERLE